MLLNIDFHRKRLSLSAAALSMLSIAVFSSFVATAQAQDALNVKAEFTIIVAYGELAMEIKDQDYVCTFEGDSWGVGLAGWSSFGPMYTTYKNNNWRAFFQTVTSFHIQGLAGAVGGAQVNFFRGDGTPVGQFNGVAAGGGVVQAGGEGTWECDRLPLAPDDRPPPPSGPAPIIVESVKISNPSREVCLNLRDPNATDGGNPDVFGCVPNADQEWRIEPVGDDFYRIRNRNRNMCLNLREQNARKGGYPDVYGCTKHPDQEWSFARTSNGTYQIWNRGQELCLNLQHSDNGGLPNVWPCTRHPDQEWSINLPSK